MSNSAVRSSVMEILAGTFRTQSGVQTLYGSPIEKNGITIIPVGKVRYGWGGGAGGRDQMGEELGGGGGGGMAMTPLGYIEIKNGKSKFKRLSHSMLITQIIGVLTLSAWIVLHCIRKV